MVKDYPPFWPCRGRKPFDQWYTPESDDSTHDEVEDSTMQAAISTAFSQMLTKAPAETVQRSGSLLTLKHITSEGAWTLLRNDHHHIHHPMLPDVPPEPTLEAQHIREEYDTNIRFRLRRRKKKSNEIATDKKTKGVQKNPQKKSNNEDVVKLQKSIEVADTTAVTKERKRKITLAKGVKKPRLILKAEVIDAEKNVEINNIKDNALTKSIESLETLTPDETRASHIPPNGIASDERLPVEASRIHVGSVFKKQSDLQDLTSSLSGGDQGNQPIHTPAQSEISKLQNGH